MRNSLLLLASACSTLALAADASDPRIARVESGLLPPARIAGTKSQSWTIAARLKHYEVPGVSLAVIADAQLSWSRAYGHTRGNEPAPLTTATTFPTGAISESVTAATLLSLVEAKQLSLDTPLASLPAPPANGPPPTLRQLLSHTAGLAGNAPLRIEAPPGSRWRPSPAGYEFVRNLAAATSGLSFADLARDRVFGPTGMSASQLDATANLSSTPSDLARFVLALHSALRDQPSFLSRTSVEAMIIAPLAGSDYGLGLGVTDTGEKLQLAHSGSTEDVRCAFVLYPRTGRGAVVMTNSDNGGPLINEILRAIAAEYNWPHYRVEEKKTVPLAAAAFDTLVGRYQHEDALSAVFREDEHFYFQIRGQKRREIFPRTELEFFFLDSPETLAFERDRTGRGLYFIRGTTPPQIFQRVR